MAENSKIEWCHHSQNFWVGCEKVSPGCKFCYAETLSKRFDPGSKLWRGERRRTQTWRDARRFNAQAKAQGVRKRVFTNSLADFFEDHPGPNEWRSEAWEVIRQCDWLDWQLLTKRPENISSMLPDDWGHGWPNVWLGTSCENQEYADTRIPKLLEVPAKVRFLSLEPLVDSISLSRWIRRVDHCNRCGAKNEPQNEDRCPECRKDGTLISTWGDAQAERYVNGKRWSTDDGDDDLSRGASIDWAIIGGESGPKARPCLIDCVKRLVEECQSAQVSVFVKQLGARPIYFNQDHMWFDGRDFHTGGFTRLTLRDKKGGDMMEWPQELRIRQFPGEISGAIDG